MIDEAVTEGEVDAAEEIDPLFNAEVVTEEISETVGEERAEAVAEEKKKVDEAKFDKLGGAVGDNAVEIDVDAEVEALAEQLGTAESPGSKHMAHAGQTMGTFEPAGQ